jgi:AcrR family transcriptional regulator
MSETVAAAPPPPPPPDTPAKTRKGEQTRAQILETALQLFRERGYEETTMRAIAEAAGVAVGNAYYYFRSKEHLIQAFYERSHDEHLQACRDLLAKETDLRARLHGVLRAKIDTSMPYHRFSAVLFKSAADPKSPLNPFSSESSALRERVTQLFAEVLEGSRTRIGNAKLREELPHLLWTYQMGIILFWIHDASPECGRTYRLIDHTVKIIVRLITLIDLPPFRPLLWTTLELLKDLREGREEKTEDQNSPTNEISGSRR